MNLKWFIITVIIFCLTVVISTLTMQKPNYSIEMENDTLPKSHAIEVKAHISPKYHTIEIHDYSVVTRDDKELTLHMDFEVSYMDSTIISLYESDVVFLQTVKDTLQNLLQDSQRRYTEKDIISDRGRSYLSTVIVQLRNGRYPFKTDSTFELQYNREPYLADIPLVPGIRRISSELVNYTLHN